MVLSPSGTEICLIPFSRILSYLSQSVAEFSLGCVALHNDDRHTDRDIDRQTDGEKSV